MTLDYFWIEAILIVVLILANGFFAASEIAMIAMRDFVDAARGILESLKQDIPFAEIPRPPDMTNDWFMAELAKESSEAET